MFDCHAVPCLVLLAILSQLMGGCSQAIQTIRLSSLVTVNDFPQNLCALKGGRLALVPSKKLDAGIDGTQTFHRSMMSSYASATASGNLKYRIDSGPWMTIADVVTIPPESRANAAKLLHRMGFDVIDREYTTNVLDEQDLKAVYGTSAQSVGRLLGADVLAVYSVSVDPTIHFASSAGAYACMVNHGFRENVQFIDVATGMSVGSLKSIGSILSYCGFRSAVARKTTGLLETRVEWFVQLRDGKWKKLTEVDMGATIQRAGSEYDAELLRDWAKQCN